jgi:hypothetical protein
MNQTGCDVLARARLAEQEHGRVGRRDLLYTRAHVTERLTVADEIDRFNFGQSREWALI